jgi:SNF2 family DNA or RNA helicase
VLQLQEDVLSHQDNQPWKTIVREFVAAHAIRQRRQATRDGSSSRKFVGTVSSGLSLKRKASSITDGARSKRQASIANEKNVESIEDLRATAARLEAQVQAGDFSPPLLRELASVKESLSLQQPREVSSAAAAASYATDSDAERNYDSVPSKYVSIERVVTQLRSRGERAVVFCETIEQVQALVSFLSAKGTVQSAGITDRLMRADREAAVRALQQGKLDCLVASIRSGAVGLNLTSANHVMFMTPCLDPAIRLQCIGRCHRIGQALPVVVHTFVLEGTIEGTKQQLSAATVVSIMLCLASATCMCLIVKPW